MVLSAYLVLGREGWSETARTRGGGHPGVLGDDEDDAEGDEVKIEVGKTRFGFYLDNMVVPYLYLDKVKAVKGCRQVLIGEGITPADLSFKAFFQEMFFFC